MVSLNRLLQRTLSKDLINELFHLSTQQLHWSRSNKGMTGESLNLEIIALQQRVILDFSEHSENNISGGKGMLRIHL